MNIFESISKTFFSKPEKISNYTINDPLKVTDELGSELDLSTLITSNMMPAQLKRVELTVDQQLITYRKLSVSAEASVLIDEIINEIYNTTKDELPKIKIDGYDIPKNLEKKIHEGFAKILNIMDFRRNGNNIIKQWYVDGHLFLECIFDNDKIKDGIKIIGVLDPLGMSREYDEQHKKIIYKYVNGSSGYFGVNSDNFVYDQEQIVYINSGIKDENGKYISYLYPAVKLNNQMNMIEDMLVVYRMTRGTEKRAIKVNVGNMPKTKAITYMTELVNKFRYKKTYNTSTGTVENNSHLMAITEDIWLPTKNSTKDIEIDTLQGGMQLGELDDLLYFRNKLMMALRVPTGRFNDDNSFDITATEINRQEERFSKFISSLRMKFNEVFIELLRRELISSNSMSEKEFYTIRKHFKFVYPDDASIAKREYNMALTQKLDLLSAIESHIGKYYSEKYVMKNILDQTDSEIEEMQKEIAEETKARMGTLDSMDTAEQAVDDTGSENNF